MVFVVCLRIPPDAMSGTDIAYGAAPHQFGRLYRKVSPVVLRASYVKSGTDKREVSVRYEEKSGTDLCSYA
eukprot:2756443-Rhodomonas_salina.1